MSNTAMNICMQVSVRTWKDLTIILNIKLIDSAAKINAPVMFKFKIIGEHFY